MHDTAHRWNSIGKMIMRTGRFLCHKTIFIGDTQAFEKLNSSREFLSALTAIGDDIGQRAKIAAATATAAVAVAVAILSASLF